MYFTESSINQSRPFFRDSIRQKTNYRFRKLSNIDNLFSKILFNREYGNAISASRIEPLYSFPTIPSTQEILNENDIILSDSEIRELLFETLVHVFPNVEPCCIGFSFSNRHYCSGWVFDPDLHNTHKNDGRGHLGIKNSFGSSEMWSLCGHPDTWPVFDVVTAGLYCDLFNSNLSLNAQDSLNKNRDAIHHSNDISSYATIFHSSLISRDLVSSIETNLVTKLNCGENNYALSTLDFIEEYFSCLDSLSLESLILDVIRAAFWKVRLKYCLWSTQTFSESRYKEPFEEKLLLAFALPHRSGYTWDEDGNSQDNFSSYLSYLVRESLIDSRHSVYPI